MRNPEDQKRTSRQEEDIMKLEKQRSRRSLTVMCAFSLALLALPSRASAQFTTIDFPGATRRTPRGINASGDIAGDYSTAAHPDPQGFVLSGGQVTTINVPGAIFTIAAGINPKGDVSGFYFNPSTHGFLLSDGQF